MNTYTTFTYSNGMTGFVLVEALATFKRKDQAVQVAQQKPEKEVLDKAMRTVQAANRKLKSNGWFFLNKDYVDREVANNRAIIV